MGEISDILDGRITATVIVPGLGFLTEGLFVGDPDGPLPGVMLAPQ